MRSTAFRRPEANRRLGAPCHGTSTAAQPWGPAPASGCGKRGTPLAVTLDGGGLWTGIPICFRHRGQQPGRRPTLRNGLHQPVLPLWTMNIMHNFLPEGRDHRRVVRARRRKIGIIDEESAKLGHSLLPGIESQRLLERRPVPNSFCKSCTLLNPTNFLLGRHSSRGGSPF